MLGCLSNPSSCLQLDSSTAPVLREVRPRGLGAGGGIMPACLPDACPPACPGPAPECSFRARSILQSWEGAMASASWQRKYWEGRQAAGRAHSSSYITWLEEEDEEKQKE